MERKIYGYHRIAAMCEDRDTGWKRGMMDNTRYGYKQAAPNYHISSSVCLQQRKLPTFFLTKILILLLIPLITTGTSTVFSHIHKKIALRLHIRGRGDRKAGEKLQSYYRTTDSN